MRRAFLFVAAFDLYNGLAVFTTAAIKNGLLFHWPTDERRLHFQCSHWLLFGESGYIQRMKELSAVGHSFTREVI